MSQRALNSACTLRHQMRAVLRLYTSRWMFWIAVAVTVAFSLILVLDDKEQRTLDTNRHTEAQVPELVPSQLVAGTFRQPILKSDEIDIPPSEKFVRLQGALVTDATLLRFLESPQILGLNLHYTSVTDIGLSALARLPNLNSLTIVGFNTIGPGLGDLKAPSQLVGLDLLHVRLNASGAKAISQHQSLKYLRISAASFNPRDLAPLKALKELRTIALQSSDADDETIDWLVKLPQLKSINLDNTLITADGVQRLRRELPGIEIEGVSSIGRRAAAAARRKKEQNRRDGWIILMPCLVMSCVLIVLLTQQFAAPRS